MVGVVEVVVVMVAKPLLRQRVSHVIDFHCHTTISYHHHMTWKCMHMHIYDTASLITSNEVLRGESQGPTSATTTSLPW